MIPKLYNQLFSWGSQTSDYKNSLVCFFKILSWALLSWKLFLIFNVQVNLLVHLQTLSTKAWGHTEADFMGKGSDKLYFLWDPRFDHVRFHNTDLIFTSEGEKKKYRLTKSVFPKANYRSGWLFKNPSFSLLNNTQVGGGLGIALLKSYPDDSYA